MVYNRFSFIYDELMAHAPYDEWIFFTQQVLKYKNTAVQSIVDLGCGTGEITIRLKKLGYDVTGVDYSSTMLAQAYEKAERENLSIQWVEQDIRKLEGFSDIDLFISYCDVINYVTDEADLKQVFSRVYDSLCEGGLFIFDVHSVYYVTKLLQKEAFAEVTDELTYIWECIPGKNEGEIYHYLTFFERKDDCYVRFEEVHHQRTFYLKTYINLLKESKFREIDFYADFSLKNNIFESMPDRIFIIAKK